MATAISRFIRNSFRCFLLIADSGFLTTLRETSLTKKSPSEPPSRRTCALDEGSGSAGVPRVKNGAASVPPQELLEHIVDFRLWVVRLRRSPSLEIPRAGGCCHPAAFRRGELISDPPLHPVTHGPGRTLTGVGGHPQPHPGHHARGRPSHPSLPPGVLIGEGSRAQVAGLRPPQPPEILRGRCHAGVPQ